MRMRKRANLDKRMERCADYLIEEPEALRGQWQETFPGHEKLYVELGCGKGRFTADTAETIPGTLYIAVEKVPDAMILAMEKIDRRGLEMSASSTRTRSFSTRCSRKARPTASTSISAIPGPRVGTRSSA